MTREEVEALAKEYERLEEQSDSAAKRFHSWTEAAQHVGARVAYADCARMLRGALAKSEAAPKRIDDGRKKVRVSSFVIAGWPNGYAMVAREIPEAGPGLWHVVALEAESDGLNCILTVLPDPSAKVSP